MEQALGPLLFGLFGGVITGGVLAQVFKERFSMWRYVLMGLLVATGLIHLLVGSGGDWLLLLNGLGYLGLVLLLFAPESVLSRMRPGLKWMIFAYTAVTIVGYFATHLTGVDLLGLGTKAIEIGILGVLLLFE